MGIENIFANGGMGSLQVGQNAQANPMPTPSGGGNPVVENLIKQLTQASQTSQQVITPPQLPPRKFEPGDTSGLYVNPNQSGGPGHNARVAIGEEIGKAVTGALQRHEDKQARDLAFNIKIMESTINTLNDQNASPEQKQLAQMQLNELASDAGKMKKIQKALGIQIFNDDKRTNVEKKAAAYAGIGKQGIGGGMGGQQQNPMSEQLGMPAGLNSQAQQLMRRFPTATGLNPNAQISAELTKAGVIPNAGELLKFASDQDYYSMMRDKFGEEQATKMAGIQEKYQHDMEEAKIKLFQAQTKTDYQDALLRMKEIHEGAYERINNARIGMLKDQLDQNIIKEKDRIKMNALRGQRTVLDDELKSETSILNTAQRIKDKKLIKSTQEQITNLKTQQDKINKEFSTLSGAQEEPSVDNSQTFNDIWAGK